jgi:hypothetical protein
VRLKEKEMSDSGGSGPSEQEAAKFLERDFNQCFQHMRHYDSQILEIVKFMFAGYTALIGGSLAIYKYAVDKNLDLAIPIVIALGVGLLFGLLMFALVTRNRVYFVFVARYVNENRQLFLKAKPLGFQNVTGMYTDPHQPPFFSPRSSQAWFSYLVAALNATLLGAAVYVASGSNQYVWWTLGIGGGALFIGQQVLAVLYLYSRDMKSAERAVWGHDKPSQARKTGTPPA